MNSPRYAPAGLLVEVGKHRIMLDRGPGAKPAGKVDAWLVTDEQGELMRNIRRLARAKGLEAHVGSFSSDKIIEAFVEAVLRAIDRDRTIVIVTSDHGHLEQLASSHAHPKTHVPTWFFGPDAVPTAARLRRPENIFQVIAEFGPRVRVA